MISRALYGPRAEGSTPLPYANKEERQRRGNGHLVVLLSYLASEKSLGGALDFERKPRYNLIIYIWVLWSKSIRVSHITLPGLSVPSYGVC